MFVCGCVGILERKKRPSIAETLTMKRHASASTGGASSPRIEDVVREGAAA
jgi:bacterioferritin-associated ferredoxin